MKKYKYFFFNFWIFFFHFLLNTHAQSQYFQQEVHYKIQVSLDDDAHMLSAFETFDYVNNSPGALNELYIHLWPNAYKNRKTALFRQLLQTGDKKAYATPEKDLGYIDSLFFKVNGEEVEWHLDSVYIDICKIILKKPLSPGGSIQVSTPFRIKIPSGKISRMGHLGQAYAISQWYPKPAVYDAYGWHAMPYLTLGEFYSEYGSFEVSITVPKNYVVGATGDLQTESEMAWLNKRAIETEAIERFEKTMDFPTSDKETKTLLFKQSNVHDFAWFADKRYHVLKGDVMLPWSKEKVTTWSLFTNSEPLLWKKSITYLNQAIYSYSLWNGDYPYKSCTAVDGTISAGTGMEYPNITIIGKSGSEIVLDGTIAHEVGHNWFYGIVGSNERDHGWMDEGVNTSNEIRYLMKYYNNDSVGVKNYLGNLGLFGRITGMNKLQEQDLNYLEYLYSARKRSEQAIETPSDQFTPTNYGTIMYAKTGVGFGFLQSFLGDSVYDACMLAYVAKWKFKHPYPVDMQKVFEEVSSRDLNWFFHSYIQTNSRNDYKISSLQRIYGDSFINPIVKGYAVRIQNKGNLVTPFSVSTLKDGKILSTKWYEGFKGSDTIHISCEHCDQIKIDALNINPDVNRKNNTFRTHGIFKGLEKPSFPFLLRVENPERTQISWTPIAGWNNYDKTMIGLSLHNLSFVSKKLEYAVAPMYGLNSKELAGSGTIRLTFYKIGGFLNQMQFSVTGNKFAYLIEKYPNEVGFLTFKHLGYERLHGQFAVRFKNHKVKSTIDKGFLFRTIHIRKDIIQYTQQNNIYFGKKIRGYEYHNLFQLYYGDIRKIDPYNIKIGIEQNPSYLKANLEYGGRISYPNTKHGVNIRFFLGTFLNKVGTDFYPLRLGNLISSNEDYLFENLYLGRSESTGILSKQFYEEEGGFKTFTAAGRSRNWIAALNLKAHLPGKLPIRVFADIGLYDASERVYDYKGLTYDAGLEIYLFENFLEVYIPFFVSKDIRLYYETNELKFQDRIRFVFNINGLSPFKLRDSLINY